MAESREVLDAECALFHRYLLGGDPPAYVRKKYCEAHGPGSHSPVTERAPTDAVVTLARRGPFLLRLADAYAAVFQRRGALRRKLVLLVAILEFYGPTSARVDVPDPGSRAGLLARIGVRGGVFVASVLAGALIVSLWRLATSRRGGAT